MSNKLNCARYLLSAHHQRQLPPDGGMEVVFAGRSNSGKSSALNTLCRQRALARVSKTPGRTQQLVFFTFGEGINKYLVDLPGYGHAKVSKDLRRHWKVFLEAYFDQRQALCGLVVVMDIRHPLKEYDMQMLNYAHRRGLPVYVLLTKADKLGRGAQGSVLSRVQQTLLDKFGGNITAQVFSSESRQGVEDACSVVINWLSL